MKEHPALQEKTESRNSRRRQYFVGVSAIVIAVLSASLARMEPSIYGFKWLLIFACGGVGSVAGVFKLRRLIHGNGMGFPSFGHGYPICVGGAMLAVSLVFSFLMEIAT